MSGRDRRRASAERTYSGSTVTDGWAYSARGSPLAAQTGTDTRAKAYGYTLSIWSAASSTLADIISALAAFAVVVSLTFDQLFADDSLGPRIPVPSMLHLLGTVGNRFVAFVLVRRRAEGALGDVRARVVGVQATLPDDFALPAETVTVRGPIHRL